MTKRLLKEALKEISTSERPSAVKGPQLVLENVLTSACSIFVFAQLLNNHLGISNLSKTFNLTYPRSENICRNPEREVHEIMELSGMTTTTLKYKL